jgi:hypothetical protein
MELLEVCPDRVLEEVLQAMKGIGNSFHMPTCGGGRELQDAQCLPVQTQLFATAQSVGTVPEGEQGRRKCSQGSREGWGDVGRDGGM